MRRREFVGLIGGAAVAWPLAARAQQTSKPVIGVLSAGIRGAPQQLLYVALRAGLKESGYVEGENVEFEYRYADGRFDRLATFASELVRHEVTALVAFSNASALAAKKATSTIPIIFGIGGDPVALGLVAGLNRPGGNVTGVYFFTQGLEAKRLSLLHEQVPSAKTIAALLNPNYQPSENQLRDLQEASARLGVELVVLRANTDSDFDTAFTTLKQQRPGALLVASSPFFFSRHEQIVALAERHGVPAIYEWSQFVSVGGLMSYGTKLADAYRQVGIYAGRVLKGTKPAELPVLQSTKFELVINLKTAKALRLTIPQSLLIQADEVIE
jgi:putative ABC transport system substrate-binding protein